jgi:hypothetical protein
VDAIWKRPLLYLLIGALQPACGQNSPPPPLDDGWLPGGARSATVQNVTDACALFLPELREGRTVDLLLLRDGDTVEIAAPSTTLPRLRAEKHDRDRFRTEEKRVPITAKNGECRGQRTQHYEGLDASPTEYHVLFHSDEDMPMGSCAGVPLPCKTVATLSIRWCPPRMPDCILTR